MGNETGSLSLCKLHEGHHYLGWERGEKEEKGEERGRNKVVLEADNYGIGSVKSEFAVPDMNKSNV